MYMYAGSICASKFNDISIRVECTCIIFNAANDMEAIGIATTHCQKQYPVNNGYFNHLAVTMKASDTHIENDVRVIAIKKGV